MCQWISRPVSRPARPRRACLALCLLGVWACSSPNASASTTSAVTLRFHPQARVNYREHWVYDVELPASGLLRTGLSFDVGVRELEPKTTGARLRYVVRQIYRAHDGVAESAPMVAGTVMQSHWNSDHSLGDVAIEASSPQLTAAARSLIEAGRFGMVIEYPDQAVAVGDAWSIEPRKVAVGPALEATLRPSYTLEALEVVGDEHVAVIAADIQLDLVPRRVSENVSIEGGGTASGSFRVRVSDGVLLDARTALHFNQEIRVQGNEVLGYREFSARSHIFTSAGNAQPNLAAEPIKLEGADPDEQRECASLLASATDRVGRAPAQSRLYLVGALHAGTLPMAHAGSALHEAGSSLVVSADAKHIELDAVAIDMKELATTLRRAPNAGQPVYVYADATLSVERLRGVVAALPRETVTRLVVRDAEDSTPPPKAPRWLEEQLKLALSAHTPAERQSQLQQLLIAHLALCDGALNAFHKALDAHRGFAQLPAQIVSAFVRCGCTTTNLDGLEASLYALFGSPDLRFLRLPRGLDGHKLPATATTRELAKLLDATGERAVHANVSSKVKKSGIRTRR